MYETIAEYDVERRKYVNKLFFRTREQEAADLKRESELGDTASQKRAARLVREKAIVEIGCDGVVRDTKGVYTLLTEPVTGAFAKSSKKDGSSQQQIRRHATVMRGRTILETFEGSRAKKIEAIAHDYGIGKQAAWFDHTRRPSAGIA